MKPVKLWLLSNCSRPTALKEVEKFKILGVCTVTQDSFDEKVGEPERSRSLADRFKWFLSDECKKIRGISLTPRHAHSVRFALAIVNQ